MEFNNNKLPVTKLNKATMTERLIGFFFLILWICLTVFTIYNPSWQFVASTALFSLVYGSYVSSLGEKYGKQR